jgi:uncharacterized protein (TIGR02145 family)
MKRLSFLLTAMLITAVCSFSQTGSITNVQVNQRTDGSGLVDVYFDLDGQDEGYFIKFRLSFDGGQIYWAVDPSTISGDIGPINSGSSKHIVWDPTQQFPDRYSPQSKLMIVAYIVDIFNPCPGYPSVTDIDGNVYYSVQIGDQCWMNENLNTTRAPSGENISRYCYGGIPANCELYGGLYDWNTLMNGASSSNGNPSGVQGICPNGWHVPSDAEWTELTDFLIANYIDINTGNVGNKLKSCRQISSPLGADCNTSAHPRWEANATHYGTNDFGFSSLPGGYYYGGSYYNQGDYGYWWSSTENGSSNAWSRVMYYNVGGVDRGDDYKTDGFSVRCVRD